MTSNLLDPAKPVQAMELQDNEKTTTRSMSMSVFQATSRRCVQASLVLQPCSRAARSCSGNCEGSLASATIAALLVVYVLATTAGSSAATPAAHDGDDGSNFNFDFGAATCAVLNSTAAAPAAIASTALAFARLL